MIAIVIVYDDFSLNILYIRSIISIIYRTGRIIITITGITTGGGAGGGTNLGSVFGGANITGSGFCPTISGGTGNVNSDGNNGSGGFVSLNTSINGVTSLPLFFTGGGGGGASNNNTGGTGGAGGYGSGGGGGGVGVTNSAGPGGRGGDGIVIISCY
jgi:hypothetical protein